VARDEDPAGVVICRTVADEAEILTLGVAGWARRRGVGQALMAATIGVARQAGATRMFLEVDVDNAGAVALYEGLGFVRAGLRKDYYDRGLNGRADALVMRLDLTSAGL
jgi:ribosomal-protein-alanine N-acetyltransferase